MLTNPAAIGLITTIITLFLQPIIALAKQNHFPKGVNAMIALLLCGAGTAGVMLLTGGFVGVADPVNWISIYGLFAATSTTIYHAVFRNSPLDQALSAWPSGGGNDQERTDTGRKQGS